MSHPHPLASPKRDIEGEDIIGWFLIGFNIDPDHEYSFDVYKDGKIYPQIPTLELEEKEKLFYKYLGDPDFHHVRFIKRTM
jgi:hypothetical protein